MATIDPARLKADAEELLKEADLALGLAEELAFMPAEVKAYLVKADQFVKDVQAFLAA
jgi:hypothetical protein